MLPYFLRPEVFPYASVEIVHVDDTVTIVSAAEVPEELLVARKTDSAPPDCPTCDGYAFEGHVCLLEHQDDQDEEPGSRCSRACGYCGRCS